MGKGAVQYVSTEICLCQPYSSCMQADHPLYNSHFNILPLYTRLRWEGLGVSPSTFECFILTNSTKIIPLTFFFVLPSSASYMLSEWQERKSIKESRTRPSQSQRASMVLCMVHWERRWMMTYCTYVCVCVCGVGGGGGYVLEWVGGRWWRMFWYAFVCRCVANKILFRIMDNECTHYIYVVTCLLLW